MSCYVKMTVFKLERVCMSVECCLMGGGVVRWIVVFFRGYRCSGESIIHIRRSTVLIIR